MRYPLLATAVLILSCPLSASAADEPRTISVDGSGFATVRPDMARLGLAVEARDPSLAQAQRDVADVTGRVLALLDDAGVESRHVDSTAASVQPHYRWNRQTETQELIGYIAARRIDVEIRDLALLGRVVEGAVAAGVNRVTPPVLDSTARRATWRTALANAAADARANAQTLADSLGVGLGPVIRIDAGSGTRPPPQPRMRGVQEMALSADAAPETFQAGDIRFDATVRAVFALE